MSFIRALEERQFSIGDNGMYVYPSSHPEDTVVRMIGLGNEAEDFCEVMFRIMDQVGVEFGLDMVNACRGRMGLPPLKEGSE